MLELGNPTQSVEVNGLLKKVHNLHIVPLSTLVVETPVTVKKVKALLPVGVVAPPSLQVAPATPKEGLTGMHAILLRMYAQNASFIDLFDTLSESLQTFMTTLQLNNFAIMTEIANLSPTSMNALPDQVVASAGAKGTEVAQLDVAVGTSLGVGMHDWYYVHADGEPVPVTFSVPVRVLSSHL